MRRTALASIVAALLLMPSVAAQGQEDCDLTVEMTRPEAGSDWNVRGADPSILTVIATGETVAWKLIAEGYVVETVMSESFPAASQQAEDGSAIEVGSAVSLLRGTDEGSVEGAARVSICIGRDIENPSVVAGVRIASDTLPYTGIEEILPAVGVAAGVMAIGALLSGTALVVGRRIVGS